MTNQDKVGEAPSGGAVEIRSSYRIQLIDGDGTVVKDTGWLESQGPLIDTGVNSFLALMPREPNNKEG